MSQAVIEAELEQAEQRAAMASGDGLAKAGGLVAGLRAKLASMHRQRAIDLEQEARDLAQRQAAERAAAIDGLETRKAELLAAFDKWQAAILAHDDQSLVLRSEYLSLQAAIRQHGRDATALGENIPIVLPDPGVRVRTLLRQYVGRVSGLPRS